MTEGINAQEEQILRASFAGAVPSVADEGFSASVTRRVHRKQWQRRLTFSAVAAIGLLVALPALSQVLMLLGDEIASFVASAQASHDTAQIQDMLAQSPLLETARAAGKGLTEFSARIDTISWYERHQILFLAIVMGIGSLIGTRMLEN